MKLELCVGKRVNSLLFLSFVTNVPPNSGTEGPFVISGYEKELNS